MANHSNNNSMLGTNKQTSTAPTPTANAPKSPSTTSPKIMALCQFLKKFNTVRVKNRSSDRFPLAEELQFMAMILMQDPSTIHLTSTSHSTPANECAWLKINRDCLTLPDDIGPGARLHLKVAADTLLAGSDKYITKGKLEVLNTAATEPVPAKTLEKFLEASSLNAMVVKHTDPTPNSTLERTIPLCLVHFYYSIDRQCVMLLDTHDNHLPLMLRSSDIKNQFLHAKCGAVLLTDLQVTHNQGRTTIPHQTFKHHDESPFLIFPCDDYTASTFKAQLGKTSWDIPTVPPLPFQALRSDIDVETFIPSMLENIDNIAKNMLSSRSSYPVTAVAMRHHDFYDVHIDANPIHSYQCNAPTDDREYISFRVNVNGNHLDFKCFYKPTNPEELQLKQAITAAVGKKVHLLGWRFSPWQKTSTQHLRQWNNSFPASSCVIVDPIPPSSDATMERKRERETPVSDTTTPCLTQQDWKR